MKLKTLLLTLSLILSGFTHSAFNFYGVDLGKLKVIEDSSKNQDEDYNDVGFQHNLIDVWQGKSLKPLRGNLSPEAGGASFINRMKVAPNTGEFWKKTNPNPFGGIFYTEDINSNIPDKDNNDLGIRYQRDMDGNKILGISKDTPDGGIQNNRINVIHTNVRELDLNQEDNPTAKQPATQLQFVNGEWVETNSEVIVPIDPDEGTTAVSATCGPGINLCIFPGDTCEYSNPPNDYFCFCNGAFWNCTKQK